MNFKHSGDYGDMVFAMALIKEMGGGNIYSIKSTATRTPMDQGKMSIIKPLLKSQSYIKEVAMLLKENIDHDLDDFRPGMADNLTYGKTLAEYHLDLYGLPYSILEKPWLNGIKPKKIIGKSVVINRTERYHSFYFPWKQVIEEWGEKSVFIGQLHEYDLFTAEFGKVDFYCTNDLLEAAQVIAGSAWFIGNQSACNAIAEGMKHNLIQETWAQNPDCMFKRSNAMHIAGAHLVLPEL